MLVKEEILSDILCRPATMFRLTSDTVPLSRCPSLEPNGVFRNITESYDFKAIVFLVQGDYQKEVVYPL